MKILTEDSSSESKRHGDYGNVHPFIRWEGCLDLSDLYAKLKTKRSKWRSVYKRIWGRSQIP